jgi:hypothetical protein
VRHGENEVRLQALHKLLKIIAFDLPLQCVAARSDASQNIKRRVVAGSDNKWRLTAILTVERFFGVFFLMTFRKIFSNEF